MAEALLGARWTAVEEEHQAEQRSEAWDQCADLARLPSILAELDKDLSRVGLVGERRVGKLVYLAVVSRLLDGRYPSRSRAASAESPSSSSALKFFPAESFYSLTAMVIRRWRTRRAAETSPSRGLRGRRAEVGSRAI